MELVEIGKSVLTTCMDVKAGESVLVITDDKKHPIGSALYEAAKELGTDALLVTMKPRAVSGQEPPAAIAAAMAKADVVLCPMSTSITHTNAKKEAVKAGVRIATMPGITEEMFRKGAMTADYGRVMELTNKVTELLTKAKTARIEKAGHILTLDLNGRPGIPSPGVYREKGQAGNLPSGEAYIAPIENGSNGTMLIDGSMVGVGLLSSPLTVTVKNGKLQSIEGADADKLSILLRNESNRTLCELGIGTNYAAQLIGVILEDEKAYHTVHIAFGTNNGFGGTNKADCHMDGILGRLGGLGARPEMIGYVSDGDGALAALAIAVKLLDMKKKGDVLPGDIFISTHICPDAPTKPHDPVPFMGSPVEIYQVSTVLQKSISLSYYEARRYHGK